MKKKKKIDNFKISKNVSKFTKIPSNSWFSIKKIENQEFDLKIKPKKNNKIITKDFVRNKSIELFLNDKQKEIFKEWFDLYKYSYNQTIKYIFSKKPKINFIELRPIVKNLFSDEMKIRIKKSKIPEHTLDEAIRDVVTSYKSAFSNLQRGNIKYFRIRYKKDKSNRVAFKLEGSSFPNGNLLSLKKYQKDNLFNLDLLYNPNYPKYKNYNSFCVSVFGHYIKTSEPINEIEKTSIVVWNKRTNRFFLKTPIDKINEKVLIEDTRDICAIDPGIRTFATVYGFNSIYQIGDNYQEMVNKEFSKITSIKTRLELEKKPKDVRKMKKRINIIQQKIENRVDDMHYKTSKLLCKNFRTILLGNLSTKSICSKKNNLSKVTKNQCYSLKFFEFQRKLENCSEILNSSYELVSESYTSKTCCNCRKINEKYSDEIFKCKFCNFSVNRDIMGSYNILYKHFDLISKDLQ